MTELYRLVYTSRNLLDGSEAERAAAVAQILATSQKNNSRVGVTGALMFNGGSFAQVLEGPRLVIESTFERIQRDRRHSDVNVLQCEPVTDRGFPNWSMAFVGMSDQGRALWNEMASRTGFDLARIEGEDLYATLHAIVLTEEGLAAEAATPAVRPSAAPDGDAGLDTRRLRAELLNTSPEERNKQAAKVQQPPTVARPAEAAADPASDGVAPQLVVLQAALAQERARTTELRNELDDLRIALVVAERHAETLRHQRDTWASRTKALASLMAQDLDEGQITDRISTSRAA